MFSAYAIKVNKNNFHKYVNYATVLPKSSQKNPNLHPVANPKELPRYLQRVDQRQ